MSDIVTRLRMRPTIARANHFGDLETDRAATKLFADVYALMREAADEIDRLRAEVSQRTAERDEAREMYCREAARHSVCRRSIMDARTIARMNGWDCFDAKEVQR